MHRIAPSAEARHLFTGVVFVVISCLLAGVAFADPRTEHDALALRKKAIEEDSLNVNYPAAVKKIQSALGRCGANKCGVPVKAGLLRDLGAMQVLNGNVDEGKANFAQALSLDASIALDPAYANPTLDGVWEEVKKGGASASVPGGAAASARSSSGDGDFIHTPPPEGQSHTPLALYLEYTGSEKLGKATVKYKGTGMTEWKSLDLKKTGDGFGSLVPCKDVLQGSIQYYVVGFNSQNDPVATLGSRNKPFSVRISAKMDGPVPSLPGRDPPTPCEDTTVSECPPDFPGCKVPKKGSGDDCEKDSQCKNGSCVGGKCIDNKEGGEDCEADKECSSGSCAGGKCTSQKGSGETCKADDDCGSGKCEDNKCAESEPRTPVGALKRWWIGVGVQGDIYLMPAADNVCMRRGVPGPPINSAGYHCADPRGGDFPGSSNANNLIKAGAKDQVNGGAAFGNVRILATIDYALSANMMVGLHGGYILFTDPTSASPGPAFPPIHAELRFTYLFGRDALLSKHVVPYLFGATGVGEFDAFVPVTVVATMGSSANENAWLSGGPFFIGAGGGIRVPFSANTAGIAGAKIEAAFGGAAGVLPGIAPEVGLQIGL